MRGSKIVWQGASTYVLAQIAGGLRDCLLTRWRVVMPIDGAVFILMEIIGAVLAVPDFKAATRERSDE